MPPSVDDASGRHSPARRDQPVPVLMRRPIVCLVTDRRRLTDSSAGTLVRLVGSAAAQGVDLVQVRERGLADGELLNLTRELLQAVAGTGTALVVNDRIDVALAADAHGVHLRGASPAPDRVRTIVPEGFLIGRSVHGVEEAAASAGADYLIVGTIFRTASKPDLEEAGGLHTLAAVCRAVSRPVVAIGGVTADNVRGIAETGAAGVAAIGLFAELYNRTPRPELDAALAHALSALRHAFTASHTIRDS